MEMIQDIRSSVAEWYSKNEDWLQDGIELIKSVLGLFGALFVATLTFSFSLALVMFVHLLKGLEAGTKKLRKNAEDYFNT
tara:strand:+ start:340 stop:579 length:240 start_codon:yes stop_codon:yes gene_type:complete